MYLTFTPKILRFRISSNPHKRLFINLLQNRLKSKTYKCLKWVSQNSLQTIDLCLLNRGFPPAEALEHEQSFIIGPV